MADLVYQAVPSSDTQSISIRSTPGPSADARMDAIISHEGYHIHHTPHHKQILIAFQKVHGRAKDQDHTLSAGKHNCQSSSSIHFHIVKDLNSLNRRIKPPLTHRFTNLLLSTTK